MKQPVLGIKEMQHFRRYLYKYIVTSLDCCNKKLHQPSIHILLVSVSESFSYIFLITKVELVVCILSMYRDGADTTISLTNKMTQNSWVLGCVGRVKTCVTPPYIFYYRVTNVVGCHYPLSLLISHAIILPSLCLHTAPVGLLWGYACCYYWLHACSDPLYCCIYTALISTCFYTVIPTSLTF